MKNLVYIQEDQLKLFIAEPDDLVLKTRTWSYFFQLYLKEQIKRTFQEDGALASDGRFALMVITERLLQNEAQYAMLKENIQLWNPNATIVYVFQEPISQFPENGYYVPFYTIDPESNLIMTYQEIFESGKIHHFLSRISDILYSIAGILISRTEYPNEAIYLASCDDSMNTLKQLIRKDLLQNGYFVYPETIENTDLESQLTNALVSVHLFGKNPETKLNKAGDLSSHFENKIAAKTTKLRAEKKRTFPATRLLKRILWIPEAGSIRNEKQEAFIEDLKKNPLLNEGAEFYWGSTELLKEAIAHAVQSQSTVRAIQASNTEQLTQLVARKEKSTFKYSDVQPPSETRYTENPGDPNSNAQSHALPDARHHDMMHWLRPEDDFRQNPFQSTDEPRPEQNIEATSETPVVITPTVSEEHSSTKL